MLQSIQQAEGYKNVVRHFAKLGWWGAAYELRSLIWLFFAIVVAIPLTHFVMDRLERREPKQ